MTRANMAFGPEADAAAPESQRREKVQMKYRVVSECVRVRGDGYLEGAKDA